MDAEILKQLNELIGHDVDACKFLQAYAKYCHGIDDIIDEKITSSEFVTNVTQLGSDLFNSNFWTRYASQLYLVDALINNDYADSCKWEVSNIEWQRAQADVLRNTANNMLFAVIFLVAGRDALRSISLKIREHSYHKHHNSLTGEPI